jgi:hypothetical protein
MSVRRTATMRFSGVSPSLARMFIGGFIAQYAILIENHTQYVIAVPVEA